MSAKQTDQNITKSGISGIWSGRYWYSKADFYIPTTVGFSANLYENNCDITGQTLEPNTFVLSELEELAATVSGGRSESLVQFVKKYDGIPELIDHDILYSGEVNETNDRIVGNWTILMDLTSSTGGFELNRISTMASLKRSSSIEL